MRKLILSALAVASVVAVSVPALADSVGIGEVGHYRAKTGVARAAEWVAPAPLASQLQ
jgi:hypothetical protein